MTTIELRGAWFYVEDGGCSARPCVALDEARGGGGSSSGVQEDQWVLS